MASKLSLLKFVDNFLFLRIDDIRRNSQYQKVVSDVGNLGEKEYQIITYITSFTLIFSPFLVVFVMYLSNANFKDQIKMKSDIYDNMNKYLSNKDSIRILGRSFISSSAFEKKEQLQSKINQIMNRNGIKNNSFIVKSLKIINSKTKLIHINAFINFKAIALEDLSKVLLDFLSKEKMKIESFSATKNDKTSLLSGKISILHYGKSQVQGQE